MSTGKESGRPTASPIRHPPASPSPSQEISPREYHHFPLVWGGLPLIHEEQLEDGRPKVVAVVVDASETAGPVWTLLSRTLPQLLRTLPADVQISLWALGGTDKGCAENWQRVQDFTSPSAARWAERLRIIRPRGAAPLSELLLRVASAFPARVRRPILLITHTARGCGEDPCAVARVLERATEDVSIHVIGVQAPESDVDGLRCLAETTGGTFYRVSSEDALAHAWQKAVGHALGGQIRVEVVGVNGRPFFPAVVVGAGGQVISTFDAWTDADLAPGVYTVSVGTPLPLAFDHVAVREGERTRVHIPVGEMHIRLIDPAGQWVRGEITVWNYSYGPFFSVFDRHAVLPLPTGVYTVSARIPTWHEPLAYARSVDLMVGEAVSSTLHVPVGTLSVEIRADRAAKDAFVTVAPYRRADTPTIAGWGHGTVSFVLPQGMYLLTFTRYAEQEVLFRLGPVSVQPGETTRLVVDVSPGKLHVLSRASDDSEISGEVTVFPAGFSTPVIVRGRVGELLEVPAGTYDVRVRRDTGEVLWMWDVQVTGRHTTAVEMIRPQARVWGYVVGNAPGPVHGRMQLVDRETGGIVAEGWSPVRWVVPTGSYRLWVTDFDVLGRRVEAGALTAEAGSPVTRTVTVDVARVRVEPADANRVRVSIAPYDDRARVLKSWSSPLPDFLIVPGTYDIRVIDAQHPDRDVWLDDVAVQAGELKVFHVRLRPNRD